MDPCWRSTWITLLGCTAWPQWPHGLGKYGGTGVSSQLLPFDNDEQSPQKLIQHLSVKSNSPPPLHALLWRTILRIIHIRVEFFHQGNINLLLSKPGESSVPVSPLELAIKFIVHPWGELHVPLWKNVLEMNVILVRSNPFSKAKREESEVESPLVVDWLQYNAYLRPSAK